MQRLMSESLLKDFLSRKEERLSKSPQIAGFEEKTSPDVGQLALVIDPAIVLPLSSFVQSSVTHMEHRSGDKSE